MFSNETDLLTEMISELDWHPCESENHLNGVDYHEGDGHYIVKFIHPCYMLPGEGETVRCKLFVDTMFADGTGRCGYGCGQVLRATDIFNIVGVVKNGQDV